MKSQEEIRRAIGTDMITRRTGRNMVADINSIVQPAQQRKTLRTLDPRGGVAEAKGRADYAAPAGGSGGGIASPLTETSYAERQYWPEQTLVSVDGLLSFRVKPIKQITQTDANTEEVIQVFAQPVVGAP